jgi:hypothetical protein
MKLRSVDMGRVWDCMLCTCMSEEGGDGEGELTSIRIFFFFSKMHELDKW